MSLRDKLTTDKIAGMRDQITALQTQRNDLLAALEMCRLEISQMHGHHHPDCGEGCPSWQAIDKADAAIAKTKKPV